MDEDTDTDVVIDALTIERIMDVDQPTGSRIRVSVAGRTDIVTILGMIEAAKLDIWSELMFGDDEDDE